MVHFSVSMFAREVRNQILFNAMALCFNDSCSNLSWSSDRLLFQCRYSGTAVEALVIEVNDVPSPLPVAAAGPLRVELRLGNGQCHTKGCVEGE